MDGAIGRIGPCPDCQLQAASNPTLVLLRFCVLSCGLASDRPADGARASAAAANDIGGGSTTAAARGRAGPARGKQRAVVSNLDSGPQTQIAHRGRSPPLYLQGDQTGRVRSNSFENVPIKTTRTRWPSGIAVFTSVTCPSDIIGSRQPWTTGVELIAIVDKIKVGGLFRRHAKFVRVRIAVLDAR